MNCFFMERILVGNIIRHIIICEVLNVIDYSLVKLNDSNIVELEKLRINAYQMDFDDMSINNTFFAKGLRCGKYIVFGAYLDNKLVGACYVSNIYNSLFIDRLFVLKSLQKSGYHIGTNLLKYVLNNKSVVEEYFNEKFSVSMLENEVLNSSIYKNLGYEDTSSFVQRKHL